MIFNDHSAKLLEGQHAFLSPSKYHWINYPPDKLIHTYMTTSLAAMRGTKLHALACMCIELNERLQSTKKTLNMFVNDAIGFKMNPERVLYFSEHCFGTADAISFRKNILRIHDLKTGTSPANMLQLIIYAAIFCLEYNIKPLNIKTFLRIYQNNAIVEHNPEPEEIQMAMDRIVEADRLLEKIDIGEHEYA